MKTRYRIEKVYCHEKELQMHLYFISAKYRWLGKWHRITLAKSKLESIESEFNQLVERAEADYKNKKEKPIIIKISSEKGVK